MKHRMVFCRALVFCLIFATILSLPSCVGKTCRTINNLLNRAYSVVELTLTTETGGQTLTSVYSINRTGSNITLVYDIETLALIDPDNPTDNPIQHDSGTAIISDGKVINGEGKQVNYPDIDRLSGGAMRFDADYFEDAEESQNHFSAKVTDVESFYGSDVKAKEMTVEVEYEPQTLKTVTICYTQSSDAKITAQYVFIV